MNQIIICGCGPGAPELLTEAVGQAVAEAEVLIGSRRLLALFSESRAERIEVGARIEDALQAMAQRRERRQVVLVSGDPGLCSFAQPVIKHFGLSACRVVPGISSVQVAFARLGLDWLDARVLSTHSGTPELALETLRPFGKIAVLAGRKESVSFIADLAEGLGRDYRCFICENLTLPQERVAEVSEAELRGSALASLALVVLVRRELLA